MYSDHSTCRYYDHCTCIYYDHSTCLMFYSAHGRGRGEALWESRGGARPPIPKKWFEGQRWLNQMWGGWAPFGHHLGMMWVSFGHHLGIIWESFGDHLGIMWKSFGYHLGTIWGYFRGDLGFMFREITGGGGLGGEGPRGSRGVWLPPQLPKNKSM